jgi:hypothetical protein
MTGVGHATVPRECQLGPVIVSHRLGNWGWWVGVGCGYGFVSRDCSS